MSKSDERAFLSQLKRVMLHIIKWFTLPEKRSNSWIKSIRDGRNKMEDIEGKIPRLNRQFARKNWNNSFSKATKEAEKQMNQKSSVESLTEKQVFNDEYKLRNKE